MLEALGQTIALHLYGETDWEAGIAAAQSAGFGGLQLPVSIPSFAVEEWPEGQLKILKGRLLNSGITLSLDCSQRIAALWLPRDISRGVITYYGRLINAAERLGAWAIVASVGCAKPDASTGSPWADWPDTEIARLRNLLQANLMRLAGLAAGRCEVCLTTADMNKDVWAVATPLIEEGYLRLCVELTPAGGLSANPDCRTLLARHMNRVRMVRIAADVTGAAVLQPILEELLRLEVREWIVVARDAAIAARLRRLLYASLDQAWTAVTGGQAPP